MNRRIRSLFKQPLKGFNQLKQADLNHFAVVQFGEFRHLEHALVAGQERYQHVTVQLVKMETPNAFALPGGHIIIGKPLLAMLGSENELSFVLAHELGRHRRHGESRRRGRDLHSYFTSRT